MSELPAGWGPCQLGEILELKYGKALLATSRDGGAYPVYGSNGIVGNHSTYLAEGPTVIVGRKGSVGEVCYSAVPCSPIDTTYYADEFEVTHSKFIYYLLRNLDLASLNKSTAIPGLNRQDAYDLEILLAPLAEQKRIAQKLDALLAQVDTLKARIDAIPALLKRFRQTVMSTAVSGKLTENWRRARYGAHDNQPFTLPSKKLGLLARFIDYRGKTPEKVGSGIPLITAKNIRKGYISREPQEFIRPDAYESWMTRGIPQLGDLVITTEAPLGNVATIDIKGRFALAQRAICLHFYEGFSSSFAAIVLQSPMLQEELLRRSTGTTVKGIKASVLKEIELPNPALEEQTEIVRRVEQLFAYADQLEAKVTAAQQRIDALTQSLLAKAFRGELVPQDPSDEPASVLLERIRTQRAATPKPKRGRKKV
ncbi:restriction endonuclease subunit S [Xanthomonas axonopodis]|uniref:restriction endonuclease subunit S n=1 Tax=Xanthomonas axonopodis TaxID=53413 RepID=UPI00099613FA|nr:restriction endonuclease subunit S [Xanthomonas axonopodis]